MRRDTFSWQHFKKISRTLLTLPCFELSWFFSSLWLVVNGLFKKKSKLSGVEGVEKSLKFLELSLCLYHWSFNTWKFHKIIITIGISKPKTKTHAMEISHGFFITPGNSTSLLLTPLLNLKFPHSVYLFNTLWNPCPQPPSLFRFFWNGICKLIKTCHWGTVTWVIFGIWKKSETNHVSKNSFKRHNINYTLMKYSTYNM